MSENNKIAITLFKVIPQCLISRIFGYLTRIPIPQSMMQSLVRWYCKKFAVKDEYTAPEDGFKTFNQFFTRKLRDGVHHIDPAPQSIVSPVDARIDQFGKIDGSTLIQAKGYDYSIMDLVPSETGNKFHDGHFMTLYLSPADYHRIHSPVSGEISGYFNIPGRLFTVQEYMVQGLKNLFPRNERIISYIETDKGLVGVCKVGALNVGRISLSYENIFTNKTFRRRKEVFYENNNRKKIEKGGELGIFNLGSTVILLFQKDMISFNSFAYGDRIRVGEKLGTFI